MKTICISIILALISTVVARADFDPIPLTPGSFNADVIVERTAPPPIPAGYTASMDGGTNNNGNTWYEQGYNTASPTSGLPPAGSTFTHTNDPNTQYTMPASYTTNNAILIDSRITNGTLTLSAPTTLTNISILNSAGSGPLTVNYTVHHASSPDETGSWSSLNWFNGPTPAWMAGGRVQGDSGTTFNNVGTVNPQLFGTQIAVSDASPVTSIDFFYSGTGGGHTCIFALSGNASGSSWIPLAVTGFTKDMVVAVGESSPTALTTATTVSMDGGTANTGNTWYERGYYPLLPNSGLPAPGTVITSADPNKTDHHYIMPANYAAPNAIYVDATLTTANVTPAAPQNYSAFSFLNATANGAVTCQAVMQYADGTSETNTFIAKDWFNGTPFAYRSDGRVNLNNRSLNNFNGGVNPRLYEAEFVLGNTVSVVTNIVLKWIAGGATSRAVILAVSATAGALKPIFGLQPQNINVYDGTNVVFNATVAGGTQPVTYQWQIGTNDVFVNLADGGNISGSTTTNLSIMSVTASNAAAYRLVASNVAGSANSSVATLTVLSSLQDVTAPSDPIIAVGGAQPAGEEVSHAIDNLTQKYLNYGVGPNPSASPFVGPAGFVVTPAMGPTRVMGLRIYTANDAEERDPADYVLEGSNDGGTNYTLISSNSLALPSDRNAGGATPVDPLNQFLQQVLFTNDISYTTYRLTVTRVKNSVAANSMQIAEIELLGIASPRLTITMNDFGDIIINSTAAGTLQSTTELKATGTVWHDEGPVGPGSPFVTTATEPAKFYRLSVP